MPFPSHSAHARFRIRQAVRCLAQGGVIAYPTEAVYGLGCDPWNPAAVRRLLALKARPPDQGLILIASEFDQLLPWVTELDPKRMAAIRATWPGPHTWLLPARPTTPIWLTGRFTTLAVRVTAHPLAAALCRTWGGAIVSTSANRAARPPARTAVRVRRALAPPPDDILGGRCAGADRPSTIRDGASGRVVRG